MKKLIAIIIAMLSFNTIAGEIMLYDKSTQNMWDVSSVTPEFAINPDMGRAWVTLSFNTYNGDGPVYQDERVKVQGLSYNPTSKQILLDVDGVQIVCATVKKFMGINIKPTGKCTFNQKYYKVKRDNGYEIETIEKLKISLNY